MEKIYSGSLNGLTNSQELDLYWDQIPNIPLGVFHDCSNLIFLNLGRNNLEKINGNVFAHLKLIQTFIILSNSRSS
jgi:hypothetical protein